MDAIVGAGPLELLVIVVLAMIFIGPDTLVDVLKSLKDLLNQ